jgi:hypothetical protein
MSMTSPSMWVPNPCECPAERYHLACTYLKIPYSFFSSKCIHQHDNSARGCALFCTNQLYKAMESCKIQSLFINKETKKKKKKKKLIRKKTQASGTKSCSLWVSRSPKSSFLIMCIRTNCRMMVWISRKIK